MSSLAQSLSRIVSSRGCAILILSSSQSNVEVLNVALTVTATYQIAYGNYWNLICLAVVGYEEGCP